MRWVIASDHAGFALKELVREWLRRKGFDVTDLGVHSAERADYPDYGHRVGEAVGRGEYARGVVVCGSGIGISIAVNRHAGARAALCHEPWSATMARVSPWATRMVRNKGTTASSACASAPSASAARCGWKARRERAPASSRK